MHNTKNFHANMALMLTCKQAWLTSVATAGAMGWQIRWVPDMKVTWRAWTDTETFARGLAATVTLEYNSIDAMNDAVEQFMI